MPLLDKLREQYGVGPLCSELHIAPSTYYHCQQQRHHPDKRSARAQRDDWLKKEIQRVYDENHQVYGVRKVWRQLLREGIRVARCTVARLMAVMGLAGVLRGKKVRTTVSRKAVAEAGFTATARACEAHPLLLALEDTTTINFSHSTEFDDHGNTITNPKTAGCWLIEEYHKAWKSGGTCVESLRMQTRDNLERMVVIKAFIAVRVLGLRQGGVSEETQNDSYEKILTPTEWKPLWVKLEGKPLPAQAPPLKWA